MTLVVNQQATPIGLGDEIAELRLYLMNVAVLSEDDLHRRSVAIEAPRERANK